VFAHICLIVSCLDYNIEHFTGDPEGVDTEDEGFHEFNLMHSKYGYVFGNMPLIDG
jgi:hypothetical protein